MENLGSPQEKAARRPEVDRVKNLIRAPFQERLHENPDFPVMDAGIKEVIRGFGLQSVATVDDLFNRTEAPGYNPAIAREKLVTLSTAVYEVMLEEKLEEAIIAGSSTTEKYLPSELKGQDKSNPEGSRFASMVVQNFIDKFGTEEKKAEVSSTLEYLDYIKNSGYNKGTFLAEQADEAYATIKKIKPNVMDKEEMGAYIKAVDYVSGLKAKNNVVVSSDSSGRRKFTKAEQARIKSAGLEVETPEGVPGGPEYESPFQVTEEEFINALRDGGQIRFDIHEAPAWSKHKEIKDKNKRAEQFWKEVVRNSIHNGAEWNLHFENDFTKIRTNPEYFMTTKDLNMYFDKGAKVAGHMMMDDLMRLYQKDNGVTMAIFKVGKDGISIDEDVVKRVRNRALYTDEIALRLALYDKGPRRNESHLEFMKRIKKESGEWFDKAVVASGEKRMVDFPVKPSKENLKTAYSMQEFFFIMHAYSQADKDRMFTPMPRQIQDKQRYMIWPNQKMARKIGALGRENRSLVAGRTGAGKDEPGETNQYKAEPATPLQLWAQVAMNFEEVLGRPADGKKYVADKIYDGEIVFGPDNMMIGFMDLLTVDAKVQDKEGKGLVPKKETLSEALYFGHDFEFSSDQVDAMAPCRDAAEQCDDAWKLFKGEVKYPLGDKAKIGEWILARNKVLGLERDISQNGKPVFTDILRDPRVVAALMYNSRGIEAKSVAIGYPVLAGAIDNSTYSTLVEYGVNAMQLMADWANPMEVKNVLLGRSIGSRKKISITEDFSQAIRLFKMDIRYSRFRDEYQRSLDSLKKRSLDSENDNLALNKLYSDAKRYAKNNDTKNLEETLSQIQKWGKEN